MATTPKTLNQLTNVTTWAGTDRVVIFGDGYENDIALSDFVLALGDYIATNYAAVDLPYLDGTDKIPVALLPTSGNSPKGEWDADNTTIVELNDGIGTAGDYRDVTDDNGGTINQGTGTLAINGNSVAVGDVIKYDGANWYIVPQVSNLFAGDSTADQAAVSGDYYRTANVNDRTLSRAPVNGLLLGDNGYVAPGLAYPGTNPIQDQFTVIITFRINSVPAASAYIAMLTPSSAASSGSHGAITIESDGTVDMNHYDGSFDTLADILGGAATLGQVYRIAYRMDSANDGLTSFVNGVKGSSVASGAGVGTTLRWNIGTSDQDNGGTEILDFVCYNRVLSDAEVALDAKIPGFIPAEDRWSDNSTATSGSLVVGTRYRIDTFVAGDDFTNAGASSNTTGVEFVATDTTPTIWTNGSTIRVIGVVHALDFTAIDGVNGVVPDLTSNGNNGAITTATKIRNERGLHIDAPSPAADEKLLTVSVNGTEKVAIDEDGTIRQEGLAVDAPVGKYVADAITTAGTVSHQIAIDIGGTTYYLVAYTHGS